MRCIQHTPRNSHLFLKGSSYHQGGGGGRGRSERKREVCTSVINTQNQVPRLPSSKVYHAPESAAKNKRPFSAFSSKPTKKKVFLSIYSQHAKRNTIIFSSNANLNALNWHSRPEVTSSDRTTEHYYPFISDNFHSFDRGNSGYYKTKCVGQKSLSKK